MSNEFKKVPSVQITTITVNGVTNYRVIRCERDEDGDLILEKFETLATFDSVDKATKYADEVDPPQS